MSDLIYSCMTKAIISEGDDIRRSLGWVTSRRGRLKVFSDRLECGDWRLPFSEIETSTLASFRSLLFIPGYILKIKTKGKIYQFGLNGGSFWKGSLPFPVTREQGSVKHSPLSVVIRVIVFGYILMWVIKKFF
jgi:hypothetical protein